LRAKSIYESKKATDEDRRLLLSYAFSEITLKDGNISVKYTKSFKFLKKNLAPINATFEQRENPVFMGVKGTFSNVNPALLRWVNDIRTLLMSLKLNLYFPKFAN